MLNQAFIAELNHEAASTRKLLERVPQDKFDWKPHEKSMSLGRLASHVAEIPGYLTVTLTTDELDFAKRGYKPTTHATTAEMVAFFDKNYQTALQALESTTDEAMRQTWTLRNNDHVIFTLPRFATLRSFAMNHLIHHRGQLSVYLRLLDIPIPGMYGPSADEM